MKNKTGGINNRIEKENINKVFKQLEGQIIKKFSVKEGIDQYFNLITDRIDLRFGVNDLGVWIEEYKKLKEK